MDRTDKLTMANVMFLGGMLAFIGSGIYEILKDGFWPTSVSPILGFINLIPYIATIMMVYGVVLYYQYFVRDVKSDNQ